MLEKFRVLYREKNYVKVATVIVVVLLAVSVMFPVLELAEVFGVNI